MSLTSINIMHLTISEIQPRKDFNGQGHKASSKVIPRSHHVDAHLHSQPMSLRSINFYTLEFLRYSADRILKVKVIKAKSKVKSLSHHEVAHIHPPANIAAKYQHPTPYSLCGVDPPFCVSGP